MEKITYYIQKTLKNLKYYIKLKRKMMKIFSKLNQLKESLILAINLEQENSIFCSTKFIYQKRLKNYKNEDFSYKIQKILKKIKNIYHNLL